MPIEKRFIEGRPIEGRAHAQVAARGNRLPDARALDLTELKTLYGRHARSVNDGSANMFSVPSHRYGFEHAHRTLNAGAADPDSIESNVLEWTKAELSWQTAISLTLQTKLDVSYEQLEGLALEGDSGDQCLVATMRIKRPVGFGGGICTAGSLEYVAFWTDWDCTGVWTHAGTVEVRVHDITSLPPGGLVYRVALPVEPTGVFAIRNKPWVARVRAVLSWAIAPSTRDADTLTTWGNHIDASVSVKPVVRVIPISARTPLPERASRSFGPGTSGPGTSGLGASGLGASGLGTSGQGASGPTLRYSRAGAPRRFATSSGGIRLLAAQ